MGHNCATGRIKTVTDGRVRKLTCESDQFVQIKPQKAVETIKGLLADPFAITTEAQRTSGDVRSCLVSRACQERKCNGRQKPRALGSHLTRGFRHGGTHGPVCLGVGPGSETPRGSSTGVIILRYSKSRERGFQTGISTVGYQWLLDF